MPRSSKTSQPTASTKKSPEKKSARAEPTKLRSSASSPSLGRVGNASAIQEHHGKWTFLTNHAHVLIVLHANPTLVLREVALQVGITERAVQRIVQDLEEEGFVRRERVGRQNHYEVLLTKALRHPIEAHKTIGDLLSLVSKSSAGRLDP